MKLQLILHLTLDPLILPILLKYNDEKNKLIIIMIAYNIININFIRKDIFLKEHITSLLFSTHKIVIKIVSKLI